MRKIYFDNNATTPLDPAVLEEMTVCLNERFGNPSSAHRFGEAAKDSIERARTRVAGLLHCDPARLVFTGGGTESNNTALLSAISAFPDKKHLIASLVEHESVLNPLQDLAGKGYELELLPVDGNGGLDLAALADAIRPDTVLVSLIGANNETGVLWPVQEIGEICRQKEVLFHCDAVQMIGKESVDAGAMAVDYLSVAAHKLHGPKGVGALYVKRTAPFTPLITGAGQENGRRAGTENVAGVVGFGMACELAGRSLPEYRRKLAVMRDRLEEGIGGIPDVLVNGGKESRVANTLNVSFENCASGALIQELDERGIAVSAHSACHGGDLDPSHVLTAMRIPEEYLHGTLRLSLSRFNTMAEVEELLAVLPGVIAKSRQVSF